MSEVNKQNETKIKEKYISITDFVKLSSDLKEKIELYNKGYYDFRVIPEIPGWLINETEYSDRQGGVPIYKDLIFFKNYNVYDMLIEAQNKDSETIAYIYIDGIERIQSKKMFLDISIKNLNSFLDYCDNNNEIKIINEAKEMLLKLAKNNKLPSIKIRRVHCETVSSYLSVISNLVLPERIDFASEYKGQNVVDGYIEMGDTNRSVSIIHPNYNGGSSVDCTLILNYLDNTLGLAFFTDCFKHEDDDGVYIEFRRMIEVLNRLF